MKPDLFSLLTIQPDPHSLAGQQLLSLIENCKHQQESDIAQVVGAVSSRSTHPAYLSKALSIIPNTTTLSPISAMVYWMRSWTDTIVGAQERAAQYHQDQDIINVKRCVDEAVDGLSLMIEGMNILLPWSVHHRQKPESIFGYVVSLVASNVHCEGEFFDRLPHYNPNEILPIASQCLVHDGFADGLARDILKSLTPIQRSICDVDDYLASVLVRNWKDGLANNQLAFVHQSLKLCHEFFPNLLASCISLHQDGIVAQLDALPAGSDATPCCEHQLSMFGLIYGFHVTPVHHQHLMDALHKHHVNLDQLNIPAPLLSGLSRQDLQDVMPDNAAPSVVKKM